MVANLYILKSNSAQTHDVILYGPGLVSGPKLLRLVAEYDPQNPHSIITRHHVDVLQATIESIPLPSTQTFRDRHRVPYMPLGTAMLRWCKNDKPVNTRFYVVNMLAPQYTAAGVDFVLGGAENLDGVIANLFDNRVPFLPIHLDKLSKKQKEKQKQDLERKQQEVEQTIKNEEAAERQQRDIERQERLQKHQQQQQQSSP